METKTRVKRRVNIGLSTIRWPETQLQINANVALLSTECVKRPCQLNKVIQLVPLQTSGQKTTTKKNKCGFKCLSVLNITD